MKIIHRSDALHTPTTREAALRRLAHANRWLLAGSVVLTGVLTDVAANAFPGHKKATGNRSHAKAKAVTHKHPQPPAAPPKQTETTKTTEQTTPAPNTEAPEQRTEQQPPESSQAPAQETPAPETKSEAPPAPETHESVPETHETAPAPESSGPVVSGGS